MRRLLQTYLVTFCLLLMGNISLAQVYSNLDSLLEASEKLDADTGKVNVLNSIGRIYMNLDPPKGLPYAEEAHRLSLKLNFEKGEGISKNVLGNIYAKMGKLDKSLDYLYQSLILIQEWKNKKWLTTAFNDLANAYNSLGDYSTAIVYHQKSSDLAEKQGNKKAMAYSYNNIANVYANQGDYEKTIDFYLKSMQILEELGNSIGVAICLNNLGIVYHNIKKLDKALEYFKKSNSVFTEMGHNRGIANTLNAIGSTYEAEGRYKEANEYFFKSLILQEELKDQQGIAVALNNIGSIQSLLGNYESAMGYYMRSIAIKEKINYKKGLLLAFVGMADVLRKLKRFDKAEEYARKGLDLAMALGAKANVMIANEKLSTIYFDQGQFKAAYKYLKNYADLKDTIYNEESSKKIAEMQTKYETVKHIKEIELLNKDKEMLRKDKEIQASEIKKNRIMLVAFGVGFALVVLLAFVIFRSYAQKRKANLQLEQQNFQINLQKEEIEEKNMNITASIRYAERIQKAILPSDEKLAELLPNSFVYFNPKDIVSGDFYWVAEAAPDGKFIWSVVDCTGHGVPGAFMSMIGNSLLNEFVNAKGNYRPDEILNELRRNIIQTLGQSGEVGEARDGMDMSICAYHRESRVLEYAGAYNPLYIVRDNKELIEIKADKQPIAYQLGKESPFTQHEIKMKEGDMIYLSSDGYADQFGGKRDKKFSYARFKELLVSIAAKGLDEQRQVLATTMDEWKGSEFEQIDDICVVGVRV